MHGLKERHTCIKKPYISVLHPPALVLCIGRATAHVARLDGCHQKRYHYFPGLSVSAPNFEPGEREGKILFCFGLFERYPLCGFLYRAQALGRSRFVSTHFTTSLIEAIAGAAARTVVVSVSTYASCTLAHLRATPVGVGGGV